jgi:hypothetical protein
MDSKNMILEDKWAEVPHGNVVAWGTSAQNIFRANGLKFPWHVSLGELRPICSKEPKKHVFQRNLSPFAMGNHVSWGTWAHSPSNHISTKELGPFSPK